MKISHNLSLLILSTNLVGVLAHPLIARTLSETKGFKGAVTPDIGIPSRTTGGGAATSVTALNSRTQTIATAKGGNKGTNSDDDGDDQGRSQRLPSTTTAPAPSKQTSTPANSRKNDSQDDDKNDEQKGNNTDSNKNTDDQNSRKGTGSNNDDERIRGNSGATLLQKNIQEASKSKGGPSAEAGQDDSATDQDNFINFCSGKTLTNGKQAQEGSCNGIVMGDIPSKNNMISSIITSPEPGEIIKANTEFKIEVQVQNLVPGSFTNPQTTYYSAPQQLRGGKVVGHTHVTIQELGNSLNAKSPPDPTKFVFFKGINDEGNGRGGLSATVAGGLPPGNYRVCSLTSSSNHQPVLMPVAQRGAQDDCTKFTVSSSSSNNNKNNNENKNSGKNQNNDNNENPKNTQNNNKQNDTSDDKNNSQNGNKNQKKPTF